MLKAICAIVSGEGVINPIWELSRLGGFEFEWKKLPKRKFSTLKLLWAPEQIRTDPRTRRVVLNLKRIRDSEMLSDTDKTEVKSQQDRNPQKNNVFFTTTK